MKTLKALPDIGILPDYTPYIVNEIPCNIPFAYYVIELIEYYGDFGDKIYRRYKKEAWRN